MWWRCQELQPAQPAYASRATADTETGACVATLEGHTNWFNNALAFLPDKNFLANGSFDNTPFKHTVLG